MLVSKENSKYGVEVPVGLLRPVHPLVFIHELAGFPDVEILEVPPELLAVAVETSALVV